MAFTVERHPDGRAWKRARLTGVGASEAAAVVGLSRWCGPLGLYLRKLEGVVEDDDDNAGEMAEAGHRHEPTLARWFAEQRTAAGELHDPGDFTIWRSAERPHVYATLDRYLDASGGPEPLELKCAWYDAAKEWAERIPVAYQVQLQHQLYVTGAARGWVACLLNGYQFRWYSMDRNERFIARLLERLDEFWDRVQRRDPPQVGEGAVEAQAVRTAYPADNGDEVQLDGQEWATTAAAWEQAREARLAAEAAELAAANRIKQAMGEARVARLPDGTGFSWATAGKTRQFRRIRRAAI